MGKTNRNTWKTKFFQQKSGIARLQLQTVHSVNQHSFEENDVAIAATAWKKRKKDINLCFLAKYKT